MYTIVYISLYVTFWKQRIIIIYFCIAIVINIIIIIIINAQQLV